MPQFQTSWCQLYYPGVDITTIDEFLKQKITRQKYHVKHEIFQEGRWQILIS